MGEGLSYEEVITLMQNSQRTNDYFFFVSTPQVAPMRSMLCSSIKNTPNDTIFCALDLVWPILFIIDPHKFGLANTRCQWKMVAWDISHGGLSRYGGTLIYWFQCHTKSNIQCLSSTCGWRCAETTTSTIQSLCHGWNLLHRERKKKPKKTTKRNLLDRGKHFKNSGN